VPKCFGKCLQFLREEEEGIKKEEDRKKKMAMKTKKKKKKKKKRRRRKRKESKQKTNKQKSAMNAHKLILTHKTALFRGQGFPLVKRPCQAALRKSRK
jgi:hypothetical protein